MEIHNVYIILVKYSNTRQYQITRARLKRKPFNGKRPPGQPETKAVRHNRNKCGGNQKYVWWKNRNSYKIRFSTLLYFRGGKLNHPVYYVIAQCIRESVKVSGPEKCKNDPHRTYCINIKKSPEYRTFFSTPKSSIDPLLFLWMLKENDDTTAHRRCFSQRKKFLLSIRFSFFFFLFFLFFLLLLLVVDFFFFVPPSPSCMVFCRFLSLSILS